MKCPVCGNDVNERSKFCSVCGSMIDPRAHGTQKKKNKKWLPFAISGVGVGLLGVAAIMIFAITPSANRLQKKLDLGNKYLEAANYDKAEIAFKDALSIDEKSTDAAVGLAETYNGKKEPEKAAQMLQKANTNMMKTPAKELTKNPVVWNEKMAHYNTVSSNTSRQLKNKGDQKTAETVDSCQKNIESVNNFVIQFIIENNITVEEPLDTLEDQEEEVAEEPVSGDAEIVFQNGDDEITPEEPDDEIISETDPADTINEEKLDEDNISNSDTIADIIVPVDVEEIDPETLEDPVDLTITDEEREQIEDDPKEENLIPTATPFPTATPTPIPVEEVYEEPVITPEPVQEPVNTPEPIVSEPDPFGGNVQEMGDWNEEPEYEQQEDPYMNDAENPEGEPAGETEQEEEAVDEYQLLEDYARNNLVPGGFAYLNNTSVSYNYGDQRSAINGVIGMYCGDLNQDEHPELLSISMRDGAVNAELYIVREGNVEYADYIAAVSSFGNASSAVTYGGSQDCFLQSNGWGGYNLCIAEYYFGLNNGDISTDARIELNAYSIGADGRFARLAGGSDRNGDNPDGFKTQISGAGLGGYWYDGCASSLQGLGLYENPIQDMSFIADPIGNGLASQESGVEDLVIVSVNMAAESYNMTVYVTDNTTFAK